MEYFRRAKNWLYYTLGYTDLRPYYAFGHEIVISPDTNYIAQSVYIDGLLQQMFSCGDWVSHIDDNTYLLCCFSAIRNNRKGMIDNGHFINTNERYVLCNSGKYFTLSLIEIPAENINAAGTCDPALIITDSAFCHEIYSGFNAYHIIYTPTQFIRILAYAANKFVCASLRTDEVFIDLETLEIIPDTCYYLSNTRFDDYVRFSGTVFIINGKKYSTDPKYGHILSNFDLLHDKFTGQIYLCGETYVAIYEHNLVQLPVQLYPENLRTKPAARETSY
jgi:hypothetical protein